MTAIAECYLMSLENNSNIDNIYKSYSGQKNYYVLYSKNVMSNESLLVIASEVPRS